MDNARIWQWIGIVRDFFHLRADVMRRIKDEIALAGVNGAGIEEPVSLEEQICIAAGVVLAYFVDGESESKAA